MNVAQRMSRLGTESAVEVLVRARALERQGKSIIHLEIGELDFDTPAHIKEAAVASAPSESGRLCRGDGHQARGYRR